MLKSSTLLALTSIAFLTACGGGEPSESDMKSALATELSKAEALTGKIEIVSLKKDKCTAAENNRFRCTFELEISMKNPLTGQQENNKESTAGVFEKVNGAWTVKEG